LTGIYRLVAQVFESVEFGEESVSAGVGLGRGAKILVRGGVVDLPPGSIGSGKADRDV
jgi:hypothetical protein